MPRIDNNNTRGQIGIGTLIIFISMVLVAAIAAGVLINTAGSLQSQAQQTSEESINLVSERINVVSTVGIVKDSDNGTMEEIRVRVSGAAGSDQIDLNETTLQVVSEYGSESLVFTGTTELNTTLSSPSSTALSNVSDIPNGGFAVQNVRGEFISAEDAIINNNDNEHFVIVLSTSNEALTNANGDTFGVDDSASISIVSPSGATTRTEIRAPSLFQADGEGVRI